MSRYVKLFALLLVPVLFVAFGTTAMAQYMRGGPTPPQPLKKKFKFQSAPVIKLGGFNIKSIKDGEVIISASEDDGGGDGGGSTGGDDGGGSTGGGSTGGDGSGGGSGSGTGSGGGSGSSSGDDPDIQTCTADCECPDGSDYTKVCYTTDGSACSCSCNTASTDECPEGVDAGYEYYRGM